MFTLESLYVSAIQVINEIRQEIIDAGISDDIQYYSWDSRGQETELPNKDLIGLMGWTYDENDGLPTIEWGILTSLVLDQNQFREVKVLDIIRRKFVVGGGDYKTVPLVDANTGEEYSCLQVAAFEVMPAGRSEIRSTRNIAIGLMKTQVDG
jgi:hypothetical protein